MAITLPAAALNLSVALVCGAVIGSERQVRQRMAGLRTNALVALGSSGFVVFSQLVEHDASPSRVAAQVVSGIGFLGAGIIFREGFNVHGLNTAATLWCSAGVGVLAGIGAWPFAVLLAGLVVFVNLGLRPLVKWLKRHTRAGLPVVRQYRLEVECAAEAEGATRALVLRNAALGGLKVQELAARPCEAGLRLSLLLAGEEAAEAQVEQAAQRLAVEPGLVRVQWQVQEDS